MCIPNSSGSNLTNIIMCHRVTQVCSNIHQDFECSLSKCVTYNKWQTHIHHLNLFISTLQSKKTIKLLFTKILLTNTQ